MSQNYCQRETKFCQKKGRNKVNGKTRRWGGGLIPSPLHLPFRSFRVKAMIFFFLLILVSTLNFSQTGLRGGGTSSWQKRGRSQPLNINQRYSNPNQEIQSLKGFEQVTKWGCMEMQVKIPPVIEKSVITFVLYSFVPR